MDAIIDAMPDHHEAQALIHDKFLENAIRREQIIRQMADSVHWSLNHERPQEDLEDSATDQSCSPIRSAIVEVVPG
ncbi:hypothetical protein BK816_04970 [Boudabousia tangfeifanii]|uniref:Uncharacterized protein n=1 Tax=Boudabousia tangfeifanii TaxID=1912795 RepID=A0A1D9MK99_9ACTO|nr:hypothetical protein BK816_04970 [Boudabousia tangfeifanii]